MRLRLLAVALVALVAAGAASAKTSVTQQTGRATATPLDFACALDKNGSLRWVTNLGECRKKETAVTILPGPTHVCVQADGSSRQVANQAACVSPGTYVKLPPLNVAEYFCADNDGRLRHVSGTGLCTGSETEVFVAPTNHAPTDIGLTPQTVAENVPNGTVVGDLTSSDIDIPNGDTHTYSFTGGNPDNAAFTIDNLSTPRKLKTNAAINFETKSSYSIMIRTTDSGGLTFDKAFTISVTDVNEAPTAVTDTYAAFGNTELVVAGHTTTTGAMAYSSSATNPKANDTDPDGIPSGFANLSVVSASGSSTKGGTYTIETDGSFKYTPPPGVVTAPGDPDTFTYGLTDGTNTVNGTIQINVTNRIWYADVARGTNGNGTSSSPFNTLAGLNGPGGAGDSDSSNDYLFLAAGTYPGGLPLETGQKLYGASHGLVVSATTLAAPTGANPVIENAAGDALTLATSGNNDVQGISLGTATGAALKGTNVGTVTVDNTTTGTIASGAGKAVDINGGALTVSFASVTGAGISLTGGTTGSFTGNGGTLSGAAGAELDVNGGTSNVTYTGAITNTAGLAVSVQNKTAGTVALSGLVSDSGSPSGVSLVSNTGATINFTGGIQLSTGTNAAFTATGGGTVNVSTGANRTLTTTTGTALTLNGIAGTITLTDLDKNGAGTGISLTNTTAAVTVPTGSTIAATTTAGVDIDGGTGAFSYAGTISNSSGRTVEVTNRNSGSPGLVQFTGSVSSTGGTGVNLDNNDNGTITFSGGLVLSTAGNAAFSATNGGTVNVTGSANTLTTTTGVALTVTGTTIGGSGLTFLSVSSNGAQRGILLNGTGSGNLTVTGDGSTANSGGTIQSTTGSPGSTGQGGNGAIDLTSTSGTMTFRFMRILAPGGNGLMAMNVTGTVSMEKSTIDHNSATIANSFAVRLENHSGSATLTLDGVLVQNKMDGSTAVSISAQDTAGVTFNVQDSNTGDSFDSKYTNLFGSGIVVGAGDNGGANGTVTTNVSNTKFLNAATNGINDLELTAQQSSVLNFNISNNTFDNVAKASAIAGIINVNATGSGRLGSAGNAATISNNTIQHIGTSSVVADLGYIAIRIAPDNSSATTHRVIISNNTILDTWRQGILVSARSLATLNLRVNNNTVGTIANPVGQSNRRGVELETQQSGILNVEVKDNPSIVGSGSNNSNSSLALRSGTDTPTNAMVNATVTGNTISNTNAGNTGRFKAETTAISGFGAGNVCLDLRNNVLDSAAKEFNVVNNGVGGSTFTLNQSGNTGTLTTVGAIGSTGSCTLPSF